MRGQQSGFTFLAALVLVTMVGASLAAFSESWSHARQREKEAELLWVGNQFVQAIGLYYQRSPGTVKRYPEKLEDLLEDKRHLTRQRYLRKVFSDPLTGKPQWGLVEAPGGGFMGVNSLSEASPIRSKDFRDAVAYRDWRFVYEPPAPRRR